VAYFLVRSMESRMRAAIFLVVLVFGLVGTTLAAVTDDV